MYVHLIAGNYSATGFEMILTRRMSHYMITYYLPSSLFVVVSWTSFLIPSEDIQGRMALLVTLFLVLVRHRASSTTQNKQNQHTYLKVNLTIYLNRALTIQLLFTTSKVVKGDWIRAPDLPIDIISACTQ